MVMNYLGCGWSCCHADGGWPRDQVATGARGSPRHCRLGPPSRQLKADHQGSRYTRRLYRLLSEMRRQIRRAPLPPVAIHISVISFIWQFSLSLSITPGLFHYNLTTYFFLQILATKVFTSSLAVPAIRITVAQSCYSVIGDNPFQ